LPIKLAASIFGRSGGDAFGFETFDPAAGGGLHFVDFDGERFVKYAHGGEKFGIIELKRGDTVGGGCGCVGFGFEFLDWRLLMGLGANFAELNAAKGLAFESGGGGFGRGTGGRGGGIAYEWDGLIERVGEHFGRNRSSHERQGGGFLCVVERRQGIGECRGECSRGNGFIRFVRIDNARGRPGCEGGARFLFDGFGPGGGDGSGSGDGCRGGFTFKNALEKARFFFPGFFDR